MLHHLKYRWLDRSRPNLGQSLVTNKLFCPACASSARLLILISSADPIAIQYMFVPRLDSIMYSTHPRIHVYDMLGLAPRAEGPVRVLQRRDPRVKLPSPFVPP